MSRRPIRSVGCSTALRTEAYPDRGDLIATGIDPLHDTAHSSPSVAPRLVVAAIGLNLRFRRNRDLPIPAPVDFGPIAVDSMERLHLPILADSMKNLYPFEGGPYIRWSPHLFAALESWNRDPRAEETFAGDWRQEHCSTMCQCQRVRAEYFARHLRRRVNTNHISRAVPECIHGS
jgi:hypothetical protein